ncbi:MAG: hypothetical protein ACJ757_04875 [Gaiellaceae bacterium]
MSERYVVTVQGRVGKDAVLLAGPFQDEASAQEFVQVEGVHGAAGHDYIVELSHPSASPVQAPGRWEYGMVA